MLVDTGVMGIAAQGKVTCRRENLKGHWQDGDLFPVQVKSQTRPDLTATTWYQRLGSTAIPEVE